MNFSRREQNCKTNLGLDPNKPTVLSYQKNAVNMCMTRLLKKELISQCAKDLGLNVNNNITRKINTGQRDIRANAIRSCVERKKQQPYNPKYQPNFPKYQSNYSTKGGARRTKRRVHKKRRTTRRK
jgi:hypothetical protein